jgi:hypothetical protein
VDLESCLVNIDVMIGFLYLGLIEYESTSQITSTFSC